MSEAKLTCGDEIILALLKLRAESGEIGPVELARSVFDDHEALEAEASIRSLGREIETVEDVARDVATHLERRQFKMASAICTSYGSLMGKTPHVVVRPFALRCAQLAETVGPATMNVESGTTFCAVLTELVAAMRAQIKVEVLRQNERANGGHAYPVGE